MRGHAEGSEVNSPLGRPNCQSEAGLTKWARLVDTLGELYELLERYAPTWYTRQHHERAESALQLVKKS